MEIKTYTKKDIATKLAHRRGLSVRSSMFRLIKRPGLNQEKS